MSRKFFSFSLIVCMLFSLLTATAVALEIKETEYSLDGGETWTEDSFLNAISACYRADNGIIRLKKNILLDETYYAPVAAYSSKTLTIDGAGHSMTRTSFYGPFLIISQDDSHVILKNLTMDGGAVWSGADAANRTNSGISCPENGSFLYVLGNASVTLESGAVLQNNHLKNSGFNGAGVFLSESSSMTMKPGSSIRNCAAEGSGGNGGGGGAVQIDRNASFRMEGGSLTGNYASVQGGAIKADGSFSMLGGQISGNAAGNNGGAVGNGTSSKITLTGDAKITENKAAVGGALLPFAFISVGGHVQITGNTTLSGKENNVHIYFPEYYLNVVSALESDAMIGISSKTAPTEEASVSVAKSGDGYTVTNTDRARFFDDTMKKYIFRLDEEIQMTPDTKAPVIAGLEADKTHCVSADFTIEEEHLASVTADGITLTPKNGVYTLPSGKHTVVVTDASGNSTTLDVTIHASHTPQDDDGNCETELLCSLCGEVVTEAKQHDFTGDWEKDANDHWHICANEGCSVSEEKTAHSFHWITDLEPTETEVGSKHEECTVCGYAKDAVEIPATAPEASSEASSEESSEASSESSEESSEASLEESSSEASSAGASTSAEPSQSAETSTDTPQTGDGSYLWVLTLLLLVSCFGIALVCSRRLRG